MPMINLIQERRNLAKQGEQRARAFLYAFVGASVVSVGAFGLLYLDTERLHAEAASLRHKMAKVQPVMNSIKDNSTQIASLGPKLTTLQDAQNTTRRWSRILEHLANNAPESIWLTQIRCSQTNTADPVSMGITGMSSNQDSVAEFLLRLKRTTDLENVRLKYTQGDFAGARQGIKFEISADIPGTAGPKPKKKKGENKA